MELWAWISQFSLQGTIAPLETGIDYLEVKHPILCPAKITEQSGSLREVLIIYFCSFSLIKAEVSLFFLTICNSLNVWVVNLSFSGREILLSGPGLESFLLRSQRLMSPPALQVKGPKLSQVDTFPTQGSSGPLVAGFSLSCDSWLRKNSFSIQRNIMN